jgi:hypothetical protein
MTRFWLGRSAAGRLLGLATAESAGKDVSHRSGKRPLLAVIF